MLSRRLLIIKAHIRRLQSPCEMFWRIKVLLGVPVFYSAGYESAGVSVRVSVKAVPAEATVRETHGSVSSSRGSHVKADNRVCLPEKEGRALFV